MLLRLPRGKLVWSDDTAESMVFGGSEVCPSFRGYIGSATVYRKKVRKPIEVRTSSYCTLSDMVVVFSFLKSSSLIVIFEVHTLYIAVIDFKKKVFNVY